MKYMETAPGLTSEQEKDIGMATRLLDTVSKHVLALLILAPSVYMALNGKVVPEWLVLSCGSVLAQYFPKFPGTPRGE